MGATAGRNVGGPFLLWQDGDDVCTHLMELLETESGNPREALRMPGHGEHSLGKHELL